MTINLNIPDIRELKPRITVFGVGGAGGNAVNNMIAAGLQGVDFVVANTDAQALTTSKAERIVQIGVQVTQGLGAGSNPEIGRAAADEAEDEIRDHLSGVHMVFVTAGMGGGTGTGAAPVIAKVARELGILTVGVVTKPFHFEGLHRMRTAESGIAELTKCVDTLLIIPNQNLFRVANEKTTITDAFAMADQVLYSGVACITDLMVKEGLINLDFADVRAVMREMGKAMMGTGEYEGEQRALKAAEAAISNPLIDDASMKGAKGLLISITGGRDLKLYEVDEAATRIRGEVDQDANIIVGATFDESLDGVIRVSVVATGIDQVATAKPSLPQTEQRIAGIAQGLRSAGPRAPEPAERPERIERPERAEPVKVVRTAAAAPAPATAPAPAPGSIDASIGSMAKAAIEKAILPPHGGSDEVAIRQLTPSTKTPSLFIDPPAHEEEAPEPEAFIPPAAVRTVRMPRMDELPLPGQNALRAHRGEPLPEDHPDTQRKSLFQRITGGLSRRGHEEEAHVAPRNTPPAPPQPAERLTGRPMPRPQEPRPEPVSEYARRPAPQGLDQHGRQAPAVHNLEEDQLDIPAFLRRSQAK
jgi:cell division protein FtsZ